MPSPTILQVLPALETGGVEQTTLDIAEALLQKGWNAVIASQGGRMEALLKDMGAVHVNLPLKTKNPLRMIKNALCLNSVIKEYEISIIHARSRAPAWSAYWAARKALLPFITTFHGTYNRTGLLKKKYNSIMASGDLVIANSAFIGGHIQTYYGISREKVRIIPRGVNLTKFDPRKILEVEKSNFKKSIGLSESDKRPILVLPGRLTPWKGQKIFLEALLYLKTHNYFALLIGDDQGRHTYRYELENFIKENRLSQNVQILGHRSDVPLVLSIADVIVSASTDPEAFGRVIIEAFAMGKPVVASRHGGALESVEDGKNGLFFTPNDPKSLTEVLERILSLPVSQRQAWGAAGQLRVKKEFTKELMCERTLEVYGELLNEKDSRY